MRRFVSIPLLAVGTVLGYGFAFHSMHHHRYQRDAWERHIADVCVGASRGVRGDNARPESPAPKTEAPEP
jgi:hypothetical protein